MMPLPKPLEHMATLHSQDDLPCHIVVPYNIAIRKLTWESLMYLVLVMVTFHP